MLQARARVIPPMTFADVAWVLGIDVSEVEPITEIATVGQDDPDVLNIVDDHEGRYPEPVIWFNSVRLYVENHGDEEAIRRMLGWRAQKVG